MQALVFFRPTISTQARPKAVAFLEAIASRQSPEFLFDVLDLFFKFISNTPVPPDRGRSHETHANGEGCGACGFGLVSWASGGLGSHCPAQLCGSVRQRAGGADERRGEKPCG